MKKTIISTTTEQALGEVSPKDSQYEEEDLIFTEPVRKHTAILDKDGDNSLISAALDLMNASDQTADSIKAKKVSLDLIMLGVAELQAMRVANVATTALILEEKLYSPENLRELKKASQISDSLTQLNSTLKESVAFIDKAMGKIKFETVELYLRDIVEGKGGLPQNNEFTKNARKVLDKISSGGDLEEIFNTLGEDETKEGNSITH